MEYCISDVLKLFEEFGLRLFLKESNWSGRKSTRKSRGVYFKYMKVALVHDYINEFGEQKSLGIIRMYPDAPIYTAFCVTSSTAEKEFKERLIESPYAPILKIWKLYSPLRF